MKLIEIAELLKKEFPGLYVSLDFCASSHQDGGPSTSITIYTNDRGHLKCSSVENGIQMLHDLIGNNEKLTQDIEVDV